MKFCYTLSEVRLTGRHRPQNRLGEVRHVVINASGRNQLALRSGANSYLIPNVMDFANPPPDVDSYNGDLRQALCPGDDDRFILQPTRVVQRKGIEHAIELVKRLDDRGPCW